MRILIPVDGSRFASAAVAFVASRRRLLGSAPEIDVLNVQLAIPPRVTRVVGREVVKSYHEAEAAGALKPALAMLRRSGAEPDATYVVGHPAEEIARAAERDRVDLIAMGSHGHAALKGLLLGSVARGVLARTRTPLLLLRAPKVPRRESLKVGVAVDGSGFSEAAVRYVIKHRTLFGATPTFTLLHAVPDYFGAVIPGLGDVPWATHFPEHVLDAQQRAFETVIAPARARFARAGIEVDEQRLIGTAGDEIARYATRHRLDLLVMGSHGHSALKSVVLGSVATRVAARCQTPLLLIRRA